MSDDSNPSPWCVDHNNRIQSLEKEVSIIKTDVTEIKGDVKYLKEKLDNGISNKLNKMHDVVIRMESKEEVRKGTQDKLDRVLYAVLYMVIAGVITTFVAMAISFYGRTSIKNSLGVQGKAQIHKAVC